MSKFESIESMLRSAEGRVLLLRWCGGGAAAAGLLVVALAAVSPRTIPGGLVLFAIVFGAFGGFAAWLIREYWRGFSKQLKMGPAEWEAEGRRLEELKLRAGNDADAAAQYVDELESLVLDLRQMLDDPPRAMRKSRPVIEASLARAEQDLAQARALQSRGAT